MAYSAQLGRLIRAKERTKRRKGWTQATVDFWENWEKQLVNGSTPTFFYDGNINRPDGYSKLIKRY